MNDTPRTFSEIRSISSSYAEALEAYGRELNQHYSAEKASSQGNGPVTVATWITYRTEGISFTRLNFLLLAAGRISVTENINYHPFHTFHSASIEGQMRRNILSGITEALGVISGFAAVCLLICGVGCYVFSVPNQGYWNIVMIFAGLLLLVASRFILRQSRLMKIPPGMFMDPSSPFRLNSAEKITADELRKA